MSNITNEVWQMLLAGKSKEEILKICSISTLKKVRAKFNKDKANGCLNPTLDSFPQPSRAKKYKPAITKDPDGEFCIPGTKKDWINQMSEGAKKILEKNNGTFIETSDRKFKASVPSGYPAVGKPEIKLTENFDKGEKIFDVKSYEIKTLDDLIKWSKIDMDEFECVSFTANRWGNEKWECTQCKGIFKPRSKKSMTPKEMADIFKDIVSDYKPLTCKNYMRRSTSSTAAIMPISDLHFGSLTKSDETGSENNLEIARENLLSSTEFHLKSIMPSFPQKLIIPILGDFYNTDTPKNTTTAGTFQEEASSWKNTSRKGVELMIEVIDMCLRELQCPVKIIVCNGNHDLMRSFALGLILEAFYKDVEDVEIDNSHAIRKYDIFGTSLFGFGHGDTKANADYLGIMCEETDAKFALAEHRTMFVGHLHHKTVEEKPGITVRRIGSLTPSNTWHKTKGYQSVRSSESYIVDVLNGIVSNSTFYLR